MTTFDHDYMSTKDDIFNPTILPVVGNELEIAAHLEETQQLKRPVKCSSLRIHLPLNFSLCIFPFTKNLYEQEGFSYLTFQKTEKEIMDILLLSAN